MRIVCIILMLVGLSACHHDHRGGSLHVDGLGGASWGGDGGHRGGKGCPPGLAKQGRCY